MDREPDYAELIAIGAADRLRKLLSTCGITDREEVSLVSIGLALSPSRKVDARTMFLRVSNALQCPVTRATFLADCIIRALHSVQTQEVL